MTTRFGVAVGWLALSPIALITNVIGIVAVCHYRRQYHGTDVVFISLLVSMATHALVLVPIPAALAIHDQGWLASELCSFYVWLGLCARMSELLVLVVMNVHWMCVLRFTSGQEVYGSATAVKALTVVAWIAAAITGMVPVLGSAFYSYYEEIPIWNSGGGGGGGASGDSAPDPALSVRGECRFLPHGIGTSFVLFFIVATLAALVLSLVASSDTLAVYKHMRRTAVQKYKAGRFYLPPASSSSGGGMTTAATTTNSGGGAYVIPGEEVQGDDSGVRGRGDYLTTPPPLEEELHNSNNNHDHYGGGASSLRLNGSVVGDHSHLSQESEFSASIPATAFPGHDHSSNPRHEGSEGDGVRGGGGGGANSAAAVVARPSTKSGVANGVPPTVHARYNELNLSAELCRVVLFFTLLVSLLNHLPFVFLQFVQLILDVDRETAETTVLSLTLIQSLVMPHVLWALSRRYRHALSYTWNVHVLRDNSVKEEGPSACTLQSYTRKLPTPGGAAVKVMANSRARGPVGNASLHEGYPNGNAVILHDDSPHQPYTADRRAFQPDTTISGRRNQYPEEAPEIITTDLDDGMTVITNLTNHKVLYVSNSSGANAGEPTASAISAVSPSSRTSTPSSSETNRARGRPQSPPSSANSRRSSQATTPSPSKASLGGTPTRSGSNIKRTASARLEWKEQMRKKHLPTIFINEAFEADEAAMARDNQRRYRAREAAVAAAAAETATGTGRETEPTRSQVQALPDVARVNVSNGDLGGGDGGRVKDAQFEYYMSSDFHHDFLRSDSLPRMESESDGGSFQYEDHDISGILDREQSLRSTGHHRLSTFLGEPPPQQLPADANDTADSQPPGTGSEQHQQQNYSQQPRAGSLDLAEHSEISFSMSGGESLPAGLQRTETSTEEDGTSSVKSDAKSDEGDGGSGGSSGEGKSRRGPPPGTRKPPRRRAFDLRQLSRPSLQHQRTIDESEQGGERDDTVFPLATADRTSSAVAGTVQQEHGLFYPVFEPAGGRGDKSPSETSTEADSDRAVGSSGLFGSGDEFDGSNPSVTSVAHPSPQGARDFAGDSDDTVAEMRPLRFTNGPSDSFVLSPVGGVSDVKLSIDNVTSDATSSDDVDEAEVLGNFSVGGDSGFRPQGQASVLGILMEEEGEGEGGGNAEPPVLHPFFTTPQLQHNEAALHTNSHNTNGYDNDDNNKTKSSSTNPQQARKPSRPLSRFSLGKSSSLSSRDPPANDSDPQARNASDLTTSNGGSGLPLFPARARLTKPARFSYEKPETLNNPLDKRDDSVKTHSSDETSDQNQREQAIERGTKAEEGGKENRSDEYGNEDVEVAGDDRKDAMITRVDSDVQPPATAVVLDIVEDETSSTTSERSVTLEPYHGDRRPPWMDADFGDEDDVVQTTPRNPFAAHPPSEMRSSDDSSDAFGSSFGSNAELGTIFGNRTLSNRSDSGNPFLYDPFDSGKVGDDSVFVQSSVVGAADRQYPIFDEETDRGFEDALALEHVIGGNPYYGNFNRCFESIEEEPEELQLSDSAGGSAFGKGGNQGEEGGSVGRTSSFPSEPSSTDELPETNPFRGMNGNPRMLKRDSPFWSQSLDVYNTSLGLAPNEDDDDHQKHDSEKQQQQFVAATANGLKSLSEEAEKDSNDLEPAKPAVSSARVRLTKPNPWPSFEKNPVNPGFDSDFSLPSNSDGISGKPGENSDGSVHGVRYESGDVHVGGLVNGAEENVSGGVDSARWRVTGPGLKGAKPPVAPRPARNGRELGMDGSTTPSVDPVYF